MSVDMGQAKVVGSEPEWVEGDVLEATRVDVGNPHVVLRWGRPALPDRDELVAIGSRIDGATPGGTNVEIVVPRDAPGELDMVVYERGVGPTLACGTGACAVAAAGHDWDAVRIHHRRPPARRTGRDRARRSHRAHRRRHLRRHPRHTVAAGVIFCR